MAFFKLIVAGILEIVWAYTLSKSEGFSKIGWSGVTLVVLLLSLYLLESVIVVFGVGMTYAIFTGIGTAGTTLMGIFVLHESANVWKCLSLVVLLIGIIGLKLTTTKVEENL